MKSSTIWIVVVILVLFGAWYWWSLQQNNQAAMEQSSGQMGIQGSSNQGNMGEPSVPPVVTVATSTALNSYLVAANGMTLYHYSKDSSGVSNCSGVCASTWPPYTVATTSAPLIAGSGAGGQLSTLTRANGTLQLTYNGMPLYFYKNDVNPGDTKGQGIGKVWFVVAP